MKIENASPVCSAFHLWFYDLRWTAEMSKATKRKHVTKEVLDEFILPTENQQVVRVSIGLVSIKQNVNNTYQFCMD